MMEFLAMMISFFLHQSTDPKIDKICNVKAEKTKNINSCKHISFDINFFDIAFNFVQNFN